MPIRMAADDLEFLTRVQEWGQQGESQSAISERLGISVAMLRYRLNRLGFEPFTQVDLRACLGGARFADLVERGELVAIPADRPAATEAVEALA